MNTTEEYTIQHGSHDTQLSLFKNTIQNHLFKRAISHALVNKRKLHNVCMDTKNSWGDTSQSKEVDNALFKCVLHSQKSSMNS